MKKLMPAIDFFLWILCNRNAIKKLIDITLIQNIAVPKLVISTLANNLGIIKKYANERNPVNGKKIGAIGNNNIIVKYTNFIMVFLVIRTPPSYYCEILFNITITNDPDESTTEVHSSL